MTCCPCCEPLAWVCRLALLLSVSAATAFSVLSLASCEFIYAKNDSTSVFIGLYMYPDDTGACQLYGSDTVFDAQTNTARACGAIAAMIGAGTFVTLLWESICCEIPCGKFLEVLGLLLATGCQGLTFMIFASGETCQSLKELSMLEFFDGNFNTGDSSGGVAGILENYPCQIGKSGGFSITAMGLFGISMLVCCMSWRPEPCMSK
mmetsp:Transcript_16395/g.20448  ORF Transcript_16395/g.20448 Transcript_16395/m.20448 type:complete len:206 (+) Transcript_16395:70-687(+)